MIWAVAILVMPGGTRKKAAGVSSKSTRSPAAQSVHAADPSDRVLGKYQRQAVGRPDRIGMCHTRLLVRRLVPVLRLLKKLFARGLRRLVYSGMLGYLPLPPDIFSIRFPPR